MLLSSSLRGQIRSSSLNVRRLNPRWLSSDDSTVSEDPEVIEDPKVPSPQVDDRGTDLRPSYIVKELDRHIVGQQEAKRAVAIAMRNRWRRRQLSPELKKEVTPRNVLMIGPTGCGKTEVARRMAALADAPFLKVEATKFTQVGYHGKDVDMIIRDLMDVSMSLIRKKYSEQFRDQAKELVEERILDVLVGSAPKNSPSRGREPFRSMLREGLIDDQLIEVDVPDTSTSSETTVTNITGYEEFAKALGMVKRVTTERKRIPISEAREVIFDVELEKLLDTVDFKKEAIAAAEETGIVFIDEIDKICTSRDIIHKSSDAGAEGVQRDLLPLIEGTAVGTKYGVVNTDYILFVTGGAFHAVKPSDLLPELQGRLPIRVELNGLSEDDLYRILTEPVANVSQVAVCLYSSMSPSHSFDYFKHSSFASKLNSLPRKVSRWNLKMMPFVKWHVWLPSSTRPLKTLGHEDFILLWSALWRI